MREPIALISNYQPQDEAPWMEILQQAMPDEHIISFKSLSPDEYQTIRCAIVANPDPQDIDKLPNLEWVHSLWAGVERLVADLGNRDLKIIRMIDPNMSRTMAESVLAWSYYLQREMPIYQRQQRMKIWQQHAYRTPQSMTVSILGLGALGREAALWVKNAGFNVLGWSRNPKQVEGVTCFHGAHQLPRVLGQSDIVVCLLPLTPQTRNLFNRQQFAAFKPGAAFINFGRGPLVNDNDLCEALDNGHLSHAVLDVFHQEPLPQESPLWDHEKITILPHIAAETPKDSAARRVAQTIAQWRATGDLPPAVDKQHGY